MRFTQAVFHISQTLASGASIARGSPPPNGGAHLAPSLRSRWDKIGQKPGGSADDLSLAVMGVRGLYDLGNIIEDDEESEEEKREREAKNAGSALGAVVGIAAGLAMSAMDDDTDDVEEDVDEDEGFDISM